MKKQNLKKNSVIAFCFIALIPFLYNSCSQKDEELTRPNTSIESKLTAGDREFVVQLWTRSGAESRQFGPTTKGVYTFPALASFNDNVSRIRVMSRYKSKGPRTMTVTVELNSQDRFGLRYGDYEKLQKTIDLKTGYNDIDFSFTLTGFKIHKGCFTCRTKYWDKEVSWIKFSAN